MSESYYKPPREALLGHYLEAKVYRLFCDRCHADAEEDELGDLIDTSADDGWDVIGDQVLCPTCLVELHPGPGKQSPSKSEGEIIP